MTIALYVIGGYLLGSIPTAVWYGKVFHGIDIRDSGSGNAGATNSLRVLGKKAGIVVLLVDIAKGFLAVYGASQLSAEPLVPMWVGLSAVFGHIFPIWAQFKGGKGVATSLGVILALFPLGAAGALVTFLLLVKLTRYVSFSSLMGPAMFLAMVAVMQPADSTSLLGFGAAIWAVLAWTHRQNLVRLWKGQEPKLGQASPPVKELAEIDEE